jgi:hypothetical protein
MEGRIVNSSAEALSVRVLVNNPAFDDSGQIQVSVPANGVRDFGADDGLKMRAQDIVTLKSPPFSDLVTQIQ